jgi:hypothetical protein
MVTIATRPLLVLPHTALPSAAHTLFGLGLTDTQIEALATVAIAALTLAYVTVAAWQLISMRRALKETRRSIDLAYRAYVFYEGIEEEYPATDGSFGIEVVVRNYGAGPARDVKVERFAEFVRAGDEAPFHKSKGIPPTAILGPRQRYKFSVFVIRDMLDVLNSGALPDITTNATGSRATNARLLVGATMSYRDVSQELRTTRFCVERTGEREWTLVESTMT